MGMGTEMPRVCVSFALPSFLSLTEKCDGPGLISPDSKEQQHSPPTLKGMQNLTHK